MDRLAQVNWLEELDLAKAYRRLVNYEEPETIAFRSTAHTNLLSVVLKQSMSSNSVPELIPLDYNFISKTLKINGGPIPGMDPSRIYGISSPDTSPASSAPSSTQKKRSLHDEVGLRTGSPGRERGPSPSASQPKKPRSHSIVHTTFRSTR